MAKAGKTGVTTNTPKKILFGAGTIHKNLTYTAGTGKTGEVAEMEINFLELTKDLIKSAVIGTDGTSADSTYDLIESKADIEAGDYFENIAFVGKTLGGKKIIFIMDNALCTSGFESEGANKEAGVGTYTFACYADIDSDLDTLPYHIYYPKTL